MPKNHRLITKIEASLEHMTSLEKGIAHFFYYNRSDTSRVDRIRDS